MVQFRTTVALSRKTATGLEVPEAIVTALDAGKRPAVTVTLNGHYTYRSTIAPMDNSFWIPLAAEHRTEANLAAGDDVQVDVELDTAPRSVDVPDDLVAALAANPQAATMWQSLSYSDQRFHVLQVTGAKTDETRQRRLAKIIDTLNAGRKR
jgi:hypothetical protein